MPANQRPEISVSVTDGGVAILLILATAEILNQFKKSIDTNYAYASLLLAKERSESSAKFSDIGFKNI